jgi:DnaK suppressor protein
MQTIDELKRTLEDERRAVLRRVNHLSDDLEHLDANIESELEEEAQEDRLADLLRRLDERSRQSLAAIDRALLRIATGEYGSCTRCEEPIDLDRLRALPAATLCISCAEALERAS